MSLIDKLFKKNKFDEKMDHAFQDFVENNRIMRDAEAKINEAADTITAGLREELGEDADLTLDRSSILDNSEAVTSEWDRMFDQLYEQKLEELKE